MVLPRSFSTDNLTCCVYAAFASERVFLRWLTKQYRLKRFPSSSTHTHIHTHCYANTHTYSPSQHTHTHTTALNFLSPTRTYAHAFSTNTHTVCRCVGVNGSMAAVIRDGADGCGCKRQQRQRRRRRCPCKRAGSKRTNIFKILKRTLRWHAHTHRWMCEDDERFLHKRARPCELCN